ncbi:hypothetical protein ES703_06512 [subsurface metagenome]
MKIVCPKCGEEIKVSGLGRRRLNIPLKNVYESLRAHRNVLAAAKQLGCSQGYIFGLLKINGLKVKDVIRGKVTLPDTKQKECIL